MSQTITQKVFYPHAAQDVWAYLTEPELIAQWLMASDFAAVVGHNFQFKTKPLPNFNFDGIINCTVLEVVPNKKLSYTWKGGNNGVVNLDSVVEWTLNEKDGGTELLLEHHGFDEANVMMYQLMSEGWLRNMNRINDLINAKKNDNANA